MRKKSFIQYELQCLRILTVVNERAGVSGQTILFEGNEEKIKFRLQLPMDTERFTRHISRNRQERIVHWAQTTRYE